MLIIYLKSYLNSIPFFFSDWTPFVPEPVYVPTGLEIEPVYLNSKEDTVVYLAEDGGHTL